MMAGLPTPTKEVFDLERKTHLLQKREYERFVRFGVLFVLAFREFGTTLG
jgi:hypothetical protein